MAATPVLLVAALLAPLLAGCATVKDEPQPLACHGAPASFVRALERAPAAVRLADGTRLSTCVSHARTDGDLQALGASLVAAADALHDRVAADPTAAVGLGYLAAAVRTGVAANQGLASTLGRRVEHATSLADDASAAAQAARARGLLAGESSG
jgi:hypothetical protein